MSDKVTAIKVQDLHSSDFFYFYSRKTGILSKDVLCNELKESGFLIKDIPDNSDWYEKLLAGCIIFMPQYLTCTLRIQDNVKLPSE